MKRVENFYRVDYMTRCLYHAVWDGAVVPTQKEAAKLRRAIQRMLDLADAQRGDEDGLVTRRRAYWSQKACPFCPIHCT